MIRIDQEARLAVALDHAFGQLAGLDHDPGVGALELGMHARDLPRKTQRFRAAQQEANRPARMQRVHVSR